MRGFREFAGKLKSASISFEAGVTLFATLSNGEMIKPLNLSKEIDSMKKCQKSLSRKEKVRLNSSALSVVFHLMLI